MKTYDVTIETVIRKTIRVEAEDERGAQEIAHEKFSVLNDEYEESYSQDVLDIEEIHGDDCASRFHSAAECTCGKSDREAGLEG